MKARERQPALEFLASAPRAYLAESRHEADSERDEKNTAESSNWHDKTGRPPVRFWQ